MQLTRYALFSGLTLSLMGLVSAPASAWTELAPGSKKSIDVLTADGYACTSHTQFGSMIEAGEIPTVASIKSEIVANYEGEDVSSCLAYTKTFEGGIDAGTNDATGAYWYRPMARNLVVRDGENVAVLEENGKLEVGSYTFDLEDDFSSRGGQLLFRFLDTESAWGQTGVTIGGVFYGTGNHTDGQYLNGDGEVVGTFAQVYKGSKKDDNIFEMTLDLADTFNVSVGKDKRGTGDGVNFQIFAKYDEPEDTTSVPEPSMALGLVAVAGLIKSRRRR
ncbi:MAG: PEP-CTERM sorting domain-containing protein [Geitlerinemataceae cyanobacterium]